MGFITGRNSTTILVGICLVLYFCPTTQQASKQIKVEAARNCWKQQNTPQKINMEPENDGLEDDFLFQLGDF